MIYINSLKNQKQIILILVEQIKFNKILFFVLSNDFEFTQSFNDYYKDLLTQRPIYPLTELEKEKEKQEFNLVHSKQDLKNWLTNSPSLSNQILNWWFDLLSSNQKNPFNCI